jgi:hypothetical protein
MLKLKHICIITYDIEKVFRSIQGEIVLNLCTKHDYI